MLQPGDRVIVYEDSGRIEGVQIERISAGKTSLAVVGGIILAPIAALGLGMQLAEQ